MQGGPFLHKRPDLPQARCVSLEELVWGRMRRARGRGGSARSVGLLTSWPYWQEPLWYGGRKSRRGCGEGQGRRECCTHVWLVHCRRAGP